LETLLQSNWCGYILEVRHLDHSVVNRTKKPGGNHHQAVVR
jgi:hypothetical protein